MVTPKAIFGDLRLNQFVALAKTQSLLRHASGTIEVRSIERISGNGRRDLVVLYPMDQSMTGEENSDACFAIMCRLEGMDPKSVRSFILATFEEITLTEESKPAIVATD